MTTIFRRCNTCLYYLGNRKCVAFEDKDIPKKIWDGDHEHTTKVRGDNGIQYEELK